MMTSTPVSGTHPRPAFTRIWNVVRLHMIDSRTYIGVPWITVAFTFVISVLIANIIGVATGEHSTAAAMAAQRGSTAVLAPQWYLIVVAVQAIVLSFPFALGFSITRLDFYLGTSLLFVLISAFNAIAFTVLTQLEKLTNGWGLNTFMFNALWFGIDAWYVDLLAYFVMQLLVFFLGASVATVYMRWRMNGMLVFWISLSLVIVGLVGLITYTRNWPTVVAWVGSQGVAGVFAWLLVPTAIAAVGGFLALRRATPKN